MLFTSSNLHYNDDGYKFLYLNGSWKTQDHCTICFWTCSQSDSTSNGTHVLQLFPCTKKKMKQFNCNKNITPQRFGPNFISQKVTILVHLTETISFCSSTVVSFTDVIYNTNNSLHLQRAYEINTHTFSKHHCQNPTSPIIIYFEVAVCIATRLLIDTIILPHTYY
jgi:hypothetical protein